MVRLVSHILILFSLLTLGACKAKKDLVRPKDELSAKTQAIWQTIEDQNIDYQWFYAKADIEVSFEDMVIGGKADLRIRKDSVIFLSIRKFGLEMARVLITRDSLFALNRLQASYTVESIDSLQSWAQVPFGFDDLQEIIVGNHPLEGQVPISSISTADGYLIKSTGDDLQLTFRTNASLYVEQAIFTDNEGRSVQLELDDWRSEGLSKIPYQRDYYYPKKNAAEYMLKLRLEKIEIDQEKKIRFEIPSNYSKL